MYTYRTGTVKPWICTIHLDRPVSGTQSVCGSCGILSKHVKIVIFQCTQQLQVYISSCMIFCILQHFLFDLRKQFL